ncbi:MAG TPA: IS200/IS605 family transposase [Thermoanaerobaculia bacterium]|nr:IS200/IS605 family transposase [Thermoanaerobaculia bacterium]
MAGTFSRLLYHVVFSTKQRAPFIDPKLCPELYPYMEGIVRRQGGWLLALGGMPDHVHVLLRLKPDMPVSDLVRHVKGGSSKWVHDQEGLSPEFAWQLGYAVFSVSESKESAVRAYIRTQENHHRRATFKEELVGLLRKHRVEYNPAYLWD